MPRPTDEDDELENEEDEDEEDDELDEEEDEDDEDEDEIDDETEDFTENLEQALLDGMEGIDTIDNRGASLRVKTIDGETFIVTIAKE